MTISERERHQLHQSLDELMGSDVAAIMMRHLPPGGWTDVATKHDLDELEGRLNNYLRASLADVRTEMHIELGSLRTDMHTAIGSLSSQMHAEIGSLRSELHAEVGSLRSDLNAEVGSLRSDLHAMTRTYILGNIALVLTVVAIMLGIERLL